MMMDRGVRALACFIGGTGFLGLVHLGATLFLLGACSQQKYIKSQAVNGASSKQATKE